MYKPSNEQKYSIQIREINPENPLYDDADSHKYIQEYVEKGFNPIYSSYTTEVCARSGDGSELIYGKMQIGSKDCFFVIVDDPGRSGYGCCGYYCLYYSYNLDELIREYTYNKDEQILLYELFTRDPTLDEESEETEGIFENLIKIRKLHEIYGQEESIIDNNPRDFNSSIAPELIDNNPKDVNPSITPEFVEKYIDEPWNWESISKNPSITPEFMENI